MTWESEYAEYFVARGATLRRLAYGLSGDWHLAQDLTQHTFLQLYRHWRRIDASSIDAYSRRIIVNAFLSNRRLRRREHVVAAIPERAVHPPDTTFSLDVRRALTDLPPKQRALVVMRHLEDISVAEAAEILGISEGTVKSQTARGLDKLRAVLAVPAIPGK